MADLPFQKRTFALEGIRSFPAGVLETLSSTFSILIANRVFQAGDFAKASLVALPSLGLLLSLFVVQAVRRSGLSANAMLALIFVISGCGFLFSSFAGDRFDLYLVGMVVALITLTLNIPLFSQIYRRHYPDKSRGSLFSMTAFGRKIFAIGAAYILGLILTASLDNYSWILRIYAAASFMMAGCVMIMARVNLDRSVKVRLFDAFRHVGKDRRFRNLLISWMILGCGNLLCFSLFVEYITNPKYGFSFDESEVSFITTIIPEALFCVFVLVWGRLFDRMNFYVLRCLINILFAIGILFYFLGNAYWALCLGIAFHGVARAGGNIAWSLWVTKFAVAEHVAEYMSVHTFLTGCRGVIAPFIAFKLASTIGPGAVGALGASLIFISTATLWPAVRDREKNLQNPPSP